MPNRLIEQLSENTAITKSRLVQAINNAVDEINKIHELYDQFFASTDGRPALAQQIEDQLESIKNKYKELFDIQEGASDSKIQDLDKKINEIRDFHRELTEGDDPILANIKDSQEKIADFYAKLFTTYEAPNDGGQEAKLKTAFDSIIAFDEELNKESIGYKTKIETAKTEILDAYEDLFGKDTETNRSKIDAFNEHIAEASEFHGKIKKEIAPFIDDKQKKINQIAADITTKQTEVDSLLSETVIRTLSEGYRRAMQIYGDPVYGTAGKGLQNTAWFAVKSTCKAAKHFIKFLGSYILFVGPLIIIGWLFVSDFSQNILTITKASGVQFSGSEYIVYKLTIALPLLWVSWYGQKSISHRKRLFEEYNHKLRVVQMYLQFITKSDTYVLGKDARVKLEDTLLDTIGKNPSEVYGKDETLLDKLIEAFKMRRSSRDKGSASAADSSGASAK